MVDAHDSKSCSFGGAGSSPASGTMEKIIVISGPTTSGKTDVAIQVAKAVDGEIVSADSRQVYIGLNELSGKVRKEEMQGISHHMLDVVEPRYVYTVHDYEKDALKCIEKIHEKGKIPIVCGGSGFYLNSIIYENTFQNIPPNLELRTKLERNSLKELNERINKLMIDAEGRIDLKNRRRIIRAIEIIRELGYFPKRNLKKRFDTNHIILNPEQKFLNEKIEDRLNRRWERMIKETKKLMDRGLSIDRMEVLGLEPKYISKIVQNSLIGNRVREKLLSEIKKYSKRQKVWFNQYSDAKRINQNEYSSIIMELI